MRRTVFKVYIVEGRLLVVAGDGAGASGGGTRPRHGLGARRQDNPHCCHHEEHRYIGCALLDFLEGLLLSINFFVRPSVRPSRF